LGWHTGNRVVLLRLEFINSQYLTDALILVFIEVALTIVTFTGGDCLFTTVIFVPFANPNPGLIFATVPFSISPFIAFIDTWIRVLRTRESWVTVGNKFYKPSH
jgi:hypothetical protein